MLASIALSGKGLQNRKSDGAGLQNRPYNTLMPYQPPPFTGSWSKNTVGLGN